MIRRLLLPALGGALAVTPLALVATPAQAVTTAPTPVCSAGTCSVTYAFTGAPQPFTVPAGVTSITASVQGASGAHGQVYGRQPDPFISGEGGSGGATIAQVPVVPGSSLTVVVGGQGTAPTTPAPDGGYGGGGQGGAQNVYQGASAGAGGGGGSFVFSGATPLVVAGGGGGGGFGYERSDGGNGGGAQDQVGLPGTDAGTAQGGRGATVSGPGAPGVVGNGGVGGGTGTGPATGPDAFGVGGVGGHSYTGGGGGGYNGGGGGAYSSDNYNHGGGGGGAGFLAPGVTAVAQSTHRGDGQVVITYTVCQPGQPSAGRSTSGFTQVWYVITSRPLFRQSKQ